MEKCVITAESVRRGHPDKFCDQIADRILDAHLTQDPNARVAVEVFATAGKIMVAGEVRSFAKVNCEKIIWELIGEIGYQKTDLCTDMDCPLKLDIRIHEQSSDISYAVDGGSEQGAGDQGIMVGYATNETLEFLPLPVVLAHALCRRMDQMAKTAGWMGADGKAQVSLVYESNYPKEASAIVVSVQHAADKPQSEIRSSIMRSIIEQAIPAELLTDNTEILINPSGKFVLGGPVADTGLTGRKLAVDQYGPAARMGGGGLSGKDASKVDRSGAYAARWIAKNIVASGLAKRCEVQIAYAIGRANPVSIAVDTFHTGTLPDSKLALAVQRTFDLRPGSITQQLQLQKPLYSPLAAYGHYGRIDVLLPWECINKKDELLCAAQKLAPLS